MLGGRLRELRKQKGLSQTELAKIFSLGRSTIAQYETGDRSPDHEMLQRLSDYFKVSADYLLGRTNNPRPTGKDLSEDTEALTILARTHPQIIELLKRISPLSEDDQEYVAEHWRWALDIIQREKEKRQAKSDKPAVPEPDKIVIANIPQLVASDHEGAGYIDMKLLQDTINDMAANAMKKQMEEERKRQQKKGK